MQETEHDKLSTHERAMRHMKNATALYREAVKVHKAEQSGLISHSEAHGLSRLVINEALEEGTKAIAAQNELIRDMAS